MKNSVAQIANSIFVFVFVAHAVSSAQEIEFNRDIRPILSDRCFQCHGPDDKKREAGLRLDLESDAKQDLGGYRAIVDGDPSESELFNRIISDDPDEQMPPPASGKKLSEKEKEVLRRWIIQGAKFQKHWAFQNPKPVARPKVDDREWVRNDIDFFVLSNLEKNGFQPSPTASRSVLIRRLYIDLIGLLPSPKEVEDFVNDPADDAYEKLVDRLLRSKHFGERMGRHWLDLARYADSNGYANDGLRSIWPYRDWVINAINQDMPFDQFTIEQLAGDLLPNATEAQKVATGFHRNTPHQTEGGSDPEQYRVERTKNRTDTTGAVWLGLTVGCAQCHSHKFDPISHEEYYQLYAFFNNADEPTIALAGAPELNRKIHLAETEIKQIENELAEAKRKKTATANAEKKSLTWHPVRFEKIRSIRGAKLKQLDDLSILASGKNPEQDIYEVQLDSKQPIKSIQLEALTDPSLPGTGPGRASNGNFVLAELEVVQSEKKVPIVSAKADHAQNGYPVTDAFDGLLNTGWAINVQGGRLNVNRKAAFALRQPVIGKLTLRLTTYEQGSGYNLGRFRISVSDSTPPGMGSLTAQLETRLKSRKKQLQSLKASVPKTLAISERAKPRKSFVQKRGDFLDPGKTVVPATLSVLHPLNPSADKNQSNRLDLARWIVSADNPLTPRVVANRVWQQLFGMGLVETENDFGYQGALPSHPELLDYLAIDLIKNGWKMKRLYKQIVLSATYRQSSEFRKDVHSVDPKNRWLARQNRFRIEGEIVRDLGLSASGLLSHKMGGPSVFPPIPPNVIGTSSANHRWPESRGEDRFRRGVYTAVYRANVYPMLSIFDGPDRDNPCTRRSRSNTPLQALTLANDKTFVEMAKAFGAKLTGKREFSSAVPSDIDGRIRLAFEVAFARPPGGRELTRIREYHDSISDHYRQHPELIQPLTGTDNHELAVWTSIARVLMNLDEFITRE